MRIFARVFAVVAVLVAGLFASASSASALPSWDQACSVTAPTQPPCVSTVLMPSGGAGTATYDCFGRVGILKANTFVVVVDWERNGTWDECFGIAPDRTIYHAWTNSVGWQQMPNNGKADNANTAFLYQGRYHTVKVIVNGVGFYCTSLINGAWGPWGRCA